MDLKTYLDREPRGSAARIARELGITAVIVSQWVRDTDPRPVPIERCVALESATGGVVTRRDSRPDDWHLIWPELAETEAAQ